MGCDELCGEPGPSVLRRADYEGLVAPELVEVVIPGDLASLLLSVAYGQMGRSDRAREAASRLWEIMEIADPSRGRE